MASPEEGLTLNFIKDKYKINFFCIHNSKEKGLKIIKVDKITGEKTNELSSLLNNNKEIIGKIEITNNAIVIKDESDDIKCILPSDKYIVTTKNITDEKYYYYIIEK